MGAVRATRRGPEEVAVPTTVTGPGGLDRRLLEEADRLLSPQLFDPRKNVKPVGTHALEVAEAVHRAIAPGQKLRDDNHAVLLLGESGSGKTTVVEECIRRVLKACPSAIVLRAYGRAYACDLECLHHFAQQLGHRLAMPFGTRASFEDTMHRTIDIFRATFEKSSALVIVLDGLEHFCSRQRQTLLYSLFDEAQNAKVNLSVVATAQKMDVMDRFEKRIWSRFEMRHYILHAPTRFEDFVAILLQRFKLPKDCELPKKFVGQLDALIKEALLKMEPKWRKDLHLGSHPLWFLQQCGGLWGLLQGAFAVDEPAVKRRRIEPSDMSLLESMTENQHVVMLAIHRLRHRRAFISLSAIREEILLLKNSGGAYLCDAHIADAFTKLADMQLVVVRGGADTAWEHRPCSSSIEHRYEEFAKELREPSPGVWNPLLQLPSAVQQWGSLSQKRHKEG